MKKLLFLCIVFSPFTSLLAMSAYLRLPVMLLFLAFGLLSPTLMKRIFAAPLRVFQDREDLLLAVLLSLVWISCGIGFGTGRSFNHALAYTFTFTVYLILFKLGARAVGLGPDDIRRAFAYGSLICCGFVIVDSLLANFFGVQIRPMLLTGGPKSFNMEYFQRGGLLSTGGTAEEPGSMAMFLNIIVPVGVWHFHSLNKRNMMLALGGMYLLSLILLTSVAGLCIFGVFAGALCLVHARAAIPYLKWALGVGVVAFGALFLKFREYFLIFGQDLSRDLLLKFSLNAESRSAEMRSVSFSSGMEHFARSPWLGNGPGYGVETLSEGYLNVFLTILADTGIFCFLCIVAYLAIVGTKAMLLPRPAPYFLLLPFFGTIIHFNIVGDYFHAPFWMLVAMVQMYYSQTHGKEKEAADSPARSGEGNAARGSGPLPASAPNP